jgi:hypothetical protein
LPTEQSQSQQSNAKLHSEHRHPHGRVRGKEERTVRVHREKNKKIGGRFVIAKP